MVSHYKIRLRVLILFLVVLTGVLALPLFTVANGGDQRVYSDEYLVNLSRSPFTPIAGTPTAMTATFVDLSTGNPIAEDLLVTVRIYQGRGGQELLRTHEDLPVENGILDLSHTFVEPGIHEIYFEFTGTDVIEEGVAPPHFLIDVQPGEDAIRLDTFTMILIGGSIFTAFLIGFGVGRGSSSAAIHK